jgi:preprotein translocase subunit SecG
VGALAVLSQLVLMFLGIFLMIVVLLQRGRGGGLAGAFGGLGGQSAFGTKAGDVFTRITVVIAIIWVVVAGGSGYFLRAAAERRARGLGDLEIPAVTAPDDASTTDGVQNDTPGGTGGIAPAGDETSEPDDATPPAAPGGSADF